MAKLVSEFQRKCSKHLGNHPLWLGVYERIEAELALRPMRTRELEHAARLMPLAPTLRSMERIGLIEKVPGSFAGKVPFENQEWRMKSGTFAAAEQPLPQTQKRYIARPKTTDRILLKIYKFEVFDTEAHEVMAYTRLLDIAEDYAQQMNENGFIDPA